MIFLSIIRIFVNVIFQVIKIELKIAMSRVYAALSDKSPQKNQNLISR